MPRSWRRRFTNCLARRLSRLGSGSRRLPGRAWRSTGRMGTRVAGRSAGCVMPALAPLVMKNEGLVGVSQGSVRRSLRLCCRCIRPRLGLSPFLLLAGMRLVSIGMMGTRAGFIRGITFAATAFALCAALLPKNLKKRSLGLRPHLLRPTYAGANMGHPYRVVLPGAWLTWGYSHVCF
jgi:hypothetical protein